MYSSSETLRTFPVEGSLVAKVGYESNCGRLLGEKLVTSLETMCPTNRMRFLAAADGCSNRFTTEKSRCKTSHKSFFKAYLFLARCGDGRSQRRTWDMVDRIAGMLMLVYRQNSLFLGNSTRSEDSLIALSYASR